MKHQKINSKNHLVLLPGLDGTGKLFAPFIEQFSDSVNITVISYPMDKHVPFELLDDYIIPLLPENVPLIILGESYSGPLALKLACRKDINIRKLILVATFAKYPDSWLKSISKFLPFSLLLHLPIPDFVIRRYCFGSSTNKRLNTLLRDSVRANNPDILAKRIHDGARVDVTDCLEDIKIPCLYIAASNDKLVPAKAINILKKHILNLDVVTIQGAHFILQIQAKVCFDVVNDFLDRAN